MDLGAAHDRRANNPDLTVKPHGPTPDGSQEPPLHHEPLCTRLRGTSAERAI